MLAFLLAVSAPNAIDPAKVRVITQQFAKCVVRRHPELASRYVLDRSLMLPRSDFVAMFDPDCVPTDGRGASSIRGNRDAMMFALADALVRQTMPTQQLSDMADIAPLDHAVPLPRYGRIPVKKASATAAKGEAATGIISMLGECVVRSNPKASHDLLLTDPASEQEGRQMTVMMPIAADCIEKGAGIALTSYSLRGTIALNYFRLAKAPPISAGVAK